MTTTRTETPTARQTPETAAAAAEEFAGRMLQLLNDGALALMTSIGHQLGLFDTLASLPPSSCGEIAEHAGLHPRYVREWLAAMVTGGIVDYAAEQQTYALPAHRAACLTRAAGAENFARVAQFLPLLGQVEQPLLACFRGGGGLPYSAYERFHAVMAEDSAAFHDTALVDGILPLITGLPARLAAGIDVLDIGCGQGHAVNLMAQAFPRSRFTGLDISEDAIAAGRDEARQLGLDNAHHEVLDVAELDRTARYDLVTAFDAIHDLVAPASALERVHAALRPDAPFLMVDFAASSRLENNLDHFLGSFLYTISCMHCTSVSLAGGGPGLGTMWGEETARQMLIDAGFADVTVARMEDDPLNYYYVGWRR